MKQKKPIVQLFVQRNGNCCKKINRLFLIARMKIDFTYSYIFFNLLISESVKPKE